MITAKQAYEWVKTGHWTYAQFSDWFEYQKAEARLRP